MTKLIKQGNVYIRKELILRSIAYNSNKKEKSMFPIVRQVTIREAAEQNGTSWKEEARQKMKADLFVLLIAVVASALTTAFYMV